MSFNAAFVPALFLTRPKNRLLSPKKKIISASGKQQTCSPKPRTEAPSKISPVRRLSTPVQDQKEQPSPSFGDRIRAPLASILNTVEQAIFNRSGHKDQAQNTAYLYSDWAPQHEGIGVHENLVIDGEVPPEVAGYFVQIGPNLQAYPPRYRHHFFDGDGAVSVFVLRSDGSASLSWQWVETEKLLAERDEGKEHFSISKMRGKIGLLYFALFIARVVTGINRFDRSTANTSILLHNGKLLALHEAHMPYALHLNTRDGSVTTKGRFSFEGLPYDGPMSAHPRRHPSNGHTYFVSYSMNPLRHGCVVQVLNPEGVLTRVIPISLPRRVMIHDTAVTERFVIIMEPSLHLSMNAMMRNDRLPFNLDKEKPVRFGLLPVDAEDDSEIQWFTVNGPGFLLLHAINAFDDDEKVIFHTLVLHDFVIELDRTTDIGHSTPYQFEMDTRTGKITSKKLPLHGTQSSTNETMPRQTSLIDDILQNEVKPILMTNFDFPTIPEHLAGKKARFAYLLGAGMHSGGRMPAVKTMVKVDLIECCEVARIELNDISGDGEEEIGCGECTFVPRHCPTSEDDGFLLTVTVSHPAGTSALRIFDAKTMNPKPVATVHAPFRLPSSFHSLFVPESEGMHMISEEKTQI